MIAKIQARDTTRFSFYECFSDNESMDIKVTLSIIGIALTFAGYVPYIRDIFKGKTKPHVFSWFV